MVLCLFINKCHLLIHFIYEKYLIFLVSNRIFCHLISKPKLIFFYSVTFFSPQLRTVMPFSLTCSRKRIFIVRGRKETCGKCQDLMENNTVLAGSQFLKKKSSKFFLCYHYFLYLDTISFLERNHFLSWFVFLLQCIDIVSF